ncbi:hypothetical protein [[Micrococcus luteus] ATCC 49442]|uniref:hypothetical protein n=1 Tax=[Micrococcus luteus] ATCC 49442 TaxID=2698727 RepID=UPI0013D97F57|nr:hypothetical protein [[Micrococcus luteus] ATCC 49442]
MIELRFSGWFQCRLATDPDPYDEPRGVSGYVHAYVGEPDLDRLLVFQDPPFTRPLGPQVGVSINEVRLDGNLAVDHALIGARVTLLNGPKFEGRNGVIAGAGLEPVYPFILEVTKGQFSLVRAINPHDPEYPYPELYAAGVEDASEEIRDATGITDLASLWRERAITLRTKLTNLGEPERTGTAERAAFLERQIGAPGGGAARFFGARMRFTYELGSQLKLHDPEHWLASEEMAEPAPWPVHFWLGGWDADVLCGFIKGTATIGAPAPAPFGRLRSAGVTDRRP